MTARARARALFTAAIFSLAVLPVSSPAEPVVSQAQLTASGEASFRDAKYAQALAAWQPALVLARRASDRKAIALLEHYIGLTYDRLERWPEARESLERALPLYRSLGDRSSEAMVLVSIGAVDIRLGRYDDASASLRRALEIDRSIRNRSGEATALGDLGILDESRGRSASALLWFQQAGALIRALGNRADEATVLVSAGNAQRNLSRYADALASYRQALDIYRSLHDRLGEAVALGDIGIVESKLGQPDEAERSYREALAIDRDLGNRLGEAALLADIAKLQSEQGRNREALEQAQQALKLERALGHRGGEANVLDMIGGIYLTLGRYDEALAARRESLAIQRALANRLGEANDLLGIGHVESDQGRYDDALRDYQSALAVYREIANPEGEADTLASMAADDRDLGRFDDALDASRRSMEIDVRIGNVGGQAAQALEIGHIQSALGRPAEALSSYQLALTLSRRLKDRAAEANADRSIGGIELGLGHFDEAMRAARTALAIDRAIGNRTGEATDLDHVGALDLMLDRVDDALTAFRAALDISRRSGDRPGEAFALGRIGAAESSRGHHAEALSALRAALAIDRESKNRRAEAKDLIELATAAFASGNVRDALTLGQQAREIAHALRDRVAEAAALDRIAFHELGLGHPDRALAAARESEALEDQTGSRSGRWAMPFVKAEAEAQLGENPAARADYERAIDGIEAEREGYTASADRSTFFANKLWPYDRYIQFLEERDRASPGLGDDRKAFAVLQRKEARALTEEIGRSAARRFRGVPAGVAVQDEATRAAVAAARQRVQMLDARAVPDAQALDAARRASVAAVAERSAFEADLRTRYPAYYALVHPSPVTAAELQHDVLQPGDVLLAYDVMEPKTILWALSRDRFEMIALPGSVQIAASVDTLRGHLRGLTADLDRRALASDVERDAAADLPGFAADAYALARAVLPGRVQPMLAAAHHVIVVPSGALFDVPWEALVTRPPTNGAAHYLIEDAAVSYVPSATVLAVVRSVQRGRRAPPLPLLAFAAPAYGTPVSAPGDVSYATMRSNAVLATMGRNGSGGFASLPNAGREAEGVRVALSAPADAVVTGERASRETILDLDRSHELAKYRYVLFATHAVLPDEVRGLTQPAIVLAHPERGGFLTMSDILGLSFDADLVALSACNTGAGPHSAGEGVSGLTRAFMYAGTRAISVTLWPLDDAAAPLISPALFRGLRNGLSPAASLREAKLAFVRADSARLRHPFSWAPTVLFGDGAGTGTSTGSRAIRSQRRGHANRSG